MRILTSAAAWLVVAGTAAAGPMQFSFSTSAVQDGDYSIAGRALGNQSLTPGSANLYSVFDIIGEYTRPLKPAPIDLYGPTLTTKFTLTDAASGASAQFDIPIYFYDNEPTPDGELDGHVPGMNAFAARKFDLGTTRYEVFATPQVLHITGESLAANTPEPSTLILAATALTLPLVRRARRLIG